jgi:hypothetical protein
MSNRFKLFVAGALAVGILSPGVCAAGPRYQTQRIPGGPRPDRFVLVRVGGGERRDRPYALTGETDGGRRVRGAYRYVPTHLKGTHSN